MANFSIVTPNYNMGIYLERTILSVLENLDSNDEYIIVDGDSTDISLEIINKYLDRIKLVKEKDSGYADAIHKGFSLAKNQYYCWINSGDLLLEGSIQKAKKLLGNGYDLVYGNDIHIDEDDKIISFSFGKVFNFYNIMLYSGWTPLQDACFWTATAYWKSKGLDKNYKYAADFDFFLRVSKDAKILFSNTFFSAFRRHEGQKSISGLTKYKYERRVSQNKQLEISNQSSLIIVIYTIYYFFVLRLRTFIFLPITRIYYILKYKL